MRRWMIVANGVFAAIFAGCLAYTFIARRHLDSMAREFVTVKTQSYADPAVSVAEEAIRAPLTRKLLTQDQLAKLEQEISEYRENPREYIAKLTGQTIPLAAKKRLDNPAVQQFAEWKAKVRAYFDRILNRLILDLRIFSGSNLVAAGLAVGIAYRGNDASCRRQVWMAFLLFAAVAYCTYMYVDSFTFFRILFNSYLGWWYPVLLGLTFFGMYLEFGRQVPATPGKGVVSSTTGGP